MLINLIYFRVPNSFRVTFRRNNNKMRVASNLHRVGSAVQSIVRLPFVDFIRDRINRVFAKEY